MSVEQIRQNILQDEDYYRDREDWGDEGPDSSAGAVRILLAEIERYEKARERVFASFRHVDGKCRCPYCTRDVEALSEIAANYELDKFEAIDRLKKVEGCDGNCSCVVFHSRHEAAFALYEKMDELAELKKQKKVAALWDDMISRTLGVSR